MRLMLAGLRTARTTRTVLSAGGILLALALIALAARSGDTHDVSDRHVPVLTPPPRTEGVASSPPPQQTQSGAGSLPLWLQILLVAIASAAVLAVATYLTLLIVRLVRGRQKRGKDEDDVLGVDIADQPNPAKIATTLTAAVDQAIIDLDQGGTADAIIACWMRFEDVAAGMGTARRPAETASDFTKRVLSTYEVNPAALSGLAELYREARFSAHVMGDPQRQAARAALESVRADLVARRAVGAAAGGDGGDH